MHATLARRTLKDARLQAFGHPLVAPPPDGFKGGLVLDDGPGDQDLRQSRYWQPCDRFPAPQPFARRLDGAWIYGGPVYHHFGHFMAEMAHRLLPARLSFPCERLVFVGIQDDPLIHDYGTLPAFVKEVAAFFAFKPENIRVVTANTVVETLHVSQAGSDFGGGPRPGYALDLREYSGRRLEALAIPAPASGKVYVSRSRLPVGGSFLGERYVEALLERDGFAVFHPQDHTLREQMSVYAGAEALIFPEGSACHGTELLGEGMIARCMLIARRRDHIEIFSRVLRPRAERFDVLDAAIDLGSAFGTPGQAPLAHAGVSLLRIGDVVDALRRSGLCALAGFSPRTFHETAGRDLDRYVAENAERGTLTSMKDAEALRTRFRVEAGL